MDKKEAIDAEKHVPWGLRQMQPHRGGVDIGHAPVGIDPASQCALFPDGFGSFTPVDARHRTGSTATMDRTQTGGGDGQNPSTDQDSIPDTDQD